VSIASAPKNFKGANNMGKRQIGLNEAFAKIWGHRNNIRPVVHEGEWTKGEWARGRSEYLTFLIKIDSEKIAERIGDVQNKLSVASCMDPFPKEYLHISVKSGGFLVGTIKSDDEISRKNITKIIDQASKTLEDVRPFKVWLKKLNIFSDVVFVEVHDNNAIKGIHKSLKERVDFLRSSRYEGDSFIPHLSICGFKNEKEFSKLLMVLEKLRNTSFGAFEVDSLDLVVAHLNHKWPILETIHTYALNAGAD
jgi:2'-5' RNA ligase